MSTQVSLCDASGPMTDLLQKLSGEDGPNWLRSLNRFLRKENPWGVAQTFEVTTIGRSGEDSITALEGEGFRVADHAQELLRSKGFVASNGIVYKLALIMGIEFEDDQRTNAQIRAEATTRGYLNPPIEVAPYVREMFSDEDLEQMGLLALIIMHKPLRDSGDRLRLLGLDSDGGGRLLSPFSGRPGDSWIHSNGFLFLVPASN